MYARYVGLGRLGYEKSKVPKMPKMPEMHVVLTTYLAKMPKVQSWAVQTVK